MFCFFCKELIPEDELCTNRACTYLNEKIKKFGLLQFYLISYGAFEKYDELVSDMKSGN